MMLGLSSLQVLELDLTSWSNLICLPDPAPTQLNQDWWSGMLQTYCLLATGTVNTPQKMEQVWTSKKDKTSPPSLLVLQLEIEKEFEAIKFNRCSLACTSVTKGTIFFSSHHVIVIFYLSQGIPSGKQIFWAFLGMCDWHFCNIQNFISQLSQLFCWRLSKSNRLSHHATFSCFQMQPLTVYLKTAWMYSVSTVWILHQKCDNHDIQIYSPKLSGMQLHNKIEKA